jgi:hypothetical protein
VLGWVLTWPDRLRDLKGRCRCAAFSAGYA